jgi:uncharacterized protein (TIGR02444 family)
LYSNDAVATACLDLQDRHGLDVNMILFCLWTAASGRGELSESEMTAGMEVGIFWQSDVVAPLRHVRRFLKGPIGPADTRLGAELGRVIADSELYAERMEILMLGELINRPATGSFALQERANKAAINLENYMNLRLGGVEDDDRQAALIIWQGAFPEADGHQTDLFHPLVVS